MAVFSRKILEETYAKYYIANPTNPKPEDMIFFDMIDLWPNVNYYFKLSNYEKGNFGLVVFEITGNYTTDVKDVTIIRTELTTDSNLIKLIRSNFELKI